MATQTTQVATQRTIIHVLLHQQLLQQLQKQQQWQQQHRSTNGLGTCQKSLLPRPKFHCWSMWAQCHISSQTPTLWGVHATVEQACQNLEPHNAEELRAEIRVTLKHSHNPRKNITKEEAQALAELKIDHSRAILTAYKGVVLVVMDRTEYMSKAQDLLEDGRTYKEIKTDQTNKLKNKLINLLKKIKAEGGITNHLYKKIAPNLWATQNS